MIRIGVHATPVFVAAGDTPLIYVCALLGAVNISDYSAERESALKNAARVSFISSGGRLRGAIKLRFPVAHIPTSMRSEYQSLCHCLFLFLRGAFNIVIHFQSCNSVSHDTCNCLARRVEAFQRDLFLNGRATRIAYIYHMFSLESTSSFFIKISNASD